MEGIDHEQLAVVALLDALEAKARVERRDRVVLRDLTACRGERLPPSPVDAEAAHRVVDHADPDASAGHAGEGLAKPRSHRVRTDPVHLEEHLVLRAGDGCKHGRERLGSVAEEAHRVFPYREPWRAQAGIYGRDRIDGRVGGRDGQGGLHLVSTLGSGLPPWR